MPKFVHELISLQAQKNPENVALRFKDDQLSYGELAAKVAQFSSVVQGLSVGRSDRVGVYLYKTFETVVSLFGASKAGATFVPINAILKAQQVQHIVNDCDIKLLVTNKGRLNSLKPLLTQMPSLQTVIVVDASDDFQTVEAHVSLISWAHSMSFSVTEPKTFSQTSTDMAAILYTSGSTGKPKGVVLSHLNMVTGAKSVAEYLKNDQDDAILAVLPLSFDYGFSQLSTAFLVGAHAVLLDYFLPNDVLKAIVKYKITGLAAVPPLWVQLTKLEWPQAARESIRYFTNSGGALTATHLSKLRELMPAASPYLMYGLTEAFRSTYLDPSEVDNRPGSMGKAIPNAEIIVVDEQGNECPDNIPGELVHKGPLVSLGYWNSPEKTAERFKSAPGKPSGIIQEELAVFSGDTVKRDKDGFLYFVGRRDEMIKSSGYRISPMEVEEVLYQYPDVFEVAAIGANHEELGQAVLVVVSVKAGVECSEQTERAIMKHCQKELATFMVPKKLILLEQLPHNANGKIDRSTLAAKYQHYFS